ncbi:phosphatidylinositol-specific phospholipase C/glycerophosphodiester phosphodiesterase family protein [Mucilaginibacter flavidus]|uniref:phosphatidylinositol-specific phospholipase C/glycerophosphodiester phosphodiesterase family protein n=1 Tax=Mucilaginibacter flavidus TaxID=2949309 RepID=UPI002091FF8C|nr:phosphatidylinositol-specific phospholipase C/glycerophosphodiester phosphodiesterase family protein [Mucilaginibacter flavidus]MCO5948504.1 phosphatidylinositol-specific phospholipase C/glycerophosphodiester phosphodiesterase family protein [Mucilaginibacter flavidus]
MRSAILSVKLLKTAALVLLFLSPLIVLSQSDPLPNAFAHNDYNHNRPLFDALENGYTNIEADVFLEDDELIIAHINPFFRPSKTLESLYLKPLARYIKNNGGEVYKGYTEPVILMIDIKTGADNTYAAIEKVLARYSSILSSFDHGVVTKKQVTVVLSGHKPYQMLKAQQTRFAFIDEDLVKSKQDTLSTNVYELSSCKYSKILRWTGHGKFPNEERARLCAYVAMAHRFRRKVRLWASPENREVWRELLNCKVDLICTDKLSELKEFLLSRLPQRENPAMMITNNTK